MPDTTPTVRLFCRPNGLPIAATGSPTTTRAESPSGTGASAWDGRIGLDQAYVAEQVVTDYARRRAVAVLKLDEQRLSCAHVRRGCRGDHVRVREDVALGETTNPDPCDA